MIDIPHQPAIQKRIILLKISIQEIAKFLGLSERQAYRIVKSFAKKDRAALCYALDTIEKEKKNESKI